MGDAQRLAGGIGEALVATASGLTVAIIAYFGHRYFRGQIVDYAVAMEREANALIDALEQPEPTATPVARPERAEPVRR
jgi:biopolymer transport protein ExbB